MTKSAKNQKIAKRPSLIVNKLINIIIIIFFRIDQKIRNCLPVRVARANRRKTAFLVVRQQIYTQMFAANTFGSWELTYFV